jgi:hypothetical protein
MNRRHGMEIGKYFFVNRTIHLWNKLPMNALGTFPSKPSSFKKVRKVVSEVKWGEDQLNSVKGRELRQGGR